ncbi:MULTISPECIES: AAA family ATPase, partial [Spirulina sp. CCY15215]|uniref:trifunctional serine/threonine-protein kinase/ATP-binding protein/sensor histidine kinase n=1 Tax=Spirulina sp. CCY15215 TaxID=2767591 RepID=UPI00194ED898
MPAQLNAIANSLLYESDRILIYRGDRACNEKPVILKTLKTAHHTTEDLAWFQREYEITRNLNILGAVKAYDFWDDRDRPTIVLEDFGGDSLTKLALAGKLSITEFLELAIAIADCLGQVHESGIIHKDINPSNIVFNPETKQVKIIDFGIATVRSREIVAFRNANTLEGTLAYISPEQTGRMNRAIDDRSDFYSLGVTFYELLTGQLPFTTTDPVELIHCHIAKQPVRNGEWGIGNIREIPSVVREIILKLMAKNAEDRYQSAYGLKGDLETCIQQWYKNQQIEAFIVGGNDRGDRLQIPQKLYGRDREIATLLSTFKQGLDRQQPALCLVKGYAGIGKSALVAEVHKPITARHGFFVAGKFDQLQRETPYSAIAHALGALMRQLLAESETELQLWRKDLQTALGDNGRAIGEIIPELELIIGQQPDIPQLGATESQYRFNLTLQNFIRVFTQGDRPLVLFLDDLQWADSASLSLLNLLMTAPDTGYFFFIGAYRDNEVDEAHPLMLTLNTIREGGIAVSEITLEPLTLADIEGFVTDALFCSPTLARPLAELLQEKTGGNPFFLNEFFKALYGEKLLFFDSQQQKWRWDVAQIRKREITANVVELLAQKIEKLPIATGQMLQFAACIGNEFDLSTLTGIARKSSLEVAIALQEAIAEGLLFPLHENYKLIEAKIKTEAKLRCKFAHDRIQQAAYSLIPDWEKRRLHLLLGRQLLVETPDNQREEKIFDIVNQLNLARPYIVKRSAKKQLAELNLEAGKKANRSAARRSAFTYLKIGLEVLPPQSWQNQYDLTLKLHIEAVETAYICGEFAVMEEWTALVLEKAKCILDRVKVYETRILSYIAKSQPKQAVETALEILKLLGVKLPQKPHKLHLLLALGQINLALINKQPKDLLDLPPMKEPTKLAALRILASVLSAAYFVNTELFGLIALKQVSLSLKYGNAPLSAYAYCNYGLILCGILVIIKRGYQFGQLGTELLAKLEAKELKSKVFMIFNTFIFHWQDHLKKTLKPLLAGYQSGIETGDIEFAAYCLGIYNNTLFFSGKNLNQTQQEINNYSQKIEQLKQNQAIYRVRHLQHALFELMGQTENSPGIAGKPYNEQALLTIHQQEGDRGALGYFYILKLQLCYCFESYEEAEKNSLQAEEYLNSMRGGYSSVLFYFYSSLTYLEICTNAPESQQKQLLDKVNTYQKKMQKWAHHAPMNFLHKYNLIAAEGDRLLGQYATAADLYDRAIQGAKEHQYIQEEALANELAGKFYLAREKDAIARAYLQQAYLCYDHWGAKAKTQRLIQKYPQFFSTPVREAFLTHIRSTIAGTRTNTPANTLDFASILKASQALGSEIVLDRLLAQMMQIILENAVAQRGILILDREGNWQVEAEVTLEPDRVQVLQSQPLDRLPASVLPQSVLTYTIHTRKAIVLDNAAEGSDFARDEYFQNVSPQSLLCMPLLHQGKMMGLLYLEHHASAGVFSRDRLEVLQLLTAQAAIALENALLYANLSRANITLEQKVQQRTEEIHQKNSDLEKTLINLKQTQAQLIQAEKMSGIGQMVAGVAHEINNPVSFIYSNLTPARTYMKDLFHLLELYRQEHSQPSLKIQETEEEMELEFVAEDYPKLFDSMKNGAQRIETIVKGLRVFSRLDEAEYKTIDIHENIESTLILLQYRLRNTKEFPTIQVLKKYGILPKITCYASQLNQVFFNILTNAIDALREGDRASSDPPSIRIQTEILGENFVRIAIADNGMGMDTVTRQRVFEPFFTTKPVGSGTGLGLSTTYQIIVEHHQGA